jgi:hypothetical protein
VSHRQRRLTCASPGKADRDVELCGNGWQDMETSQSYLNDLRSLLEAMPPGQIDMRQIEANERRHGHRFYGSPETVHQWLIDQQRIAQANRKR